MSYEKVNIDLKKKVKKALVCGGFVLTGVLAGKSQPTTTVEEIDGKVVGVGHLDKYGKAAAATLGATLALSAGLFTKSGRKNFCAKIDRFCGRD